MNEVRFSSTRLDELMDRRKVTNPQLAKLTGISKTMIYYLRKGQRNTASAEYIDRIAHALSTSSDYLLEKTEDDSPVKQKISALMADIVGIAEELSPAKQRQLKELGNALAKIDKSTDVDAVYGELMDLIGRLTKLKGGDKAIGKLAEYLVSLSSGAAPVTVKGRTRDRRRGDSDRKSTEEPTQGGE